MPDHSKLILNDRYELERELGRGGMSVVYLARDRQLLSKRVVIKILLDESSLDPWIRQKFLQEMEALSRIDHPGVVGVLDTGLTSEGKQFLVMQYIEGETLRAVIKSGVSFPRAAGLIRQIGHALSAAHEKGVWHRDLKPENVMVQTLGGEDHVKLIDFGIAGIQNSQFSGEQTKVAGSFAYMAPEQFEGNACAASDTYALGVVAYEMLTGVRPGASGELRQELPRPVDASIRRALSHQPGLRPASVREFSEELYHALTGGETTRHRSAVPGGVEMAHVLFTDLVGYSLLPMDRQKEYLGELQQIVREAPQFRTSEAGGDIISLPTGDGMALAFFGDPTAPAQCALEVAAGLKSRPHLKLRMGIHSGPVYRVADVNANANVAGGGINMAQRVMDCGDAGHILVSKSVADVLMQLSHWSTYLTDLGECTVKHGVKVHLCNLATPELGNPARPQKLVATKARAKSRAGLIAALALVVIGTSGVLWFGKAGKGSQSARDERSIAVLPFDDLSPQKDQQYFSEGLAEELLNALSKVPGLRVVAKASSFKFKNEEPREIGSKLNVANLLGGSVRKQGSRAKISVQLIQASDGRYVWSETYNNELDDIFAVQEGIAQKVTGALNLRLVQAKTAPSARKVNFEAHNAYLQGRYFLGRRSKENLEKAAGYFEQATKLDPNYAPAWVGLGECRSNQAGSGYFPPDETYEQARTAVKRALALDPDSGEANSAFGWIQMHHDWDWEGADASSRRALELAPGNAIVISHTGIVARALGRFDQATTLGRRAIQLDPLSFGNYHNAGVAFYYAGLNDEAEKTFQKALEMAPEVEIARCFLGRVYLAQSHPQKALAEMEKEKQPVLRLFGLALAYHALGRKNESDTNLEALIKNFDWACYQIAEVCAFRGQTDRAFQFLEKEYANKGTGFAQIKGDPLLKSLERDPRYALLLKKVRLPL